MIEVHNAVLTAPPHDKVDVWTMEDGVLVNFPLFQVQAKADGTVMVLDEGGSTLYEHTFSFPGGPEESA